MTEILYVLIGLLVVAVLVKFFVLPWLASRNDPVSASTFTPMVSYDAPAASYMSPEEQLADDMHRQARLRTVTAWKQREIDRLSTVFSGESPAPKSE